MVPIQKPMFTRRHYFALGNAIAQGAAKGSIVDALCTLFAQDNKEFNKDRFKMFLRTKINSQLEKQA
jgi:hypothetical protein